MIELKNFIKDQKTIIYKGLLLAEIQDTLEKTNGSDKFIEGMKYIHEIIKKWPNSRFAKIKKLNLGQGRFIEFK